VASSPPVSPPGAGVPGETPPPPPTKWPRWRVFMLIGALILLVASILETSDDVPRWLSVGLYFGGYVLLAYGFFTAMSARRGGSSPRDRG
jgi:hypothetical protein